MSWSYVSRNPPNIGSQQDNSICFQWRFAWRFSNPEIVIIARFISGDFIHILGSNHSTLLWDFVILFHQDSNNLGHQGLRGKRSWALKICLLFDSRCFDSRFDLLTFWLKNLKMFSGLCRFTSVLCHCARMAKGAPVESGGTTWFMCFVWATVHQEVCQSWFSCETGELQNANVHYFGELFSKNIFTSSSMSSKPGSFESTSGVCGGVQFYLTINQFVEQVNRIMKVVADRVALHFQQFCWTTLSRVTAATSRLIEWCGCGTN